MSRGYFGIGIEYSKKEVNIGTLWRTAHAFGASFIFTIGRRYTQQASDTCKTPKHVPLYHYATIEEFKAARPVDTMIVGIELDDNTIVLPSFSHPERAIYVLGAEDYGLSKEMKQLCNMIVAIPEAKFCLNVATAGSIVIYDRIAKNGGKDINE